MDDVAALRALAFFGPAALVAALPALTRPGRRVAAGAALAGLWSLTFLLPLNVVAEGAGWWRFGTSGGELAGIPVDAWFGWALLWGVVPVLLPGRTPVVALVAGAVWVDLVVMPRGAPMAVLGDGWLAGEAVAAAVALVPGLVLARATGRERMLLLRAALQVVLFGGLVGGVAVSGALQATGGSWSHLSLGGPATGVALQLLAVLAVPALAAVDELWRRGGGTPFPYDPPERLVATGPYAYVANPMQISMTMLLMGGGAVLRSWGVVAMGLAGAAFAAGVAGWHEDVQLDERHGGAWTRYRAEVRTWWPRWRPWAGEGAPAVLYMAPGCDPCDGVGRWVTRRRPVGLAVHPATESPQPLTRLAYVAPDGLRAHVAAYARAFEHLRLGWAFAGWCLRLPGLGWFVQVIVDAVGGGPVQEPVGGRTEGPLDASGCGLARVRINIGEYEVDVARTEGGGGRRRTDPGAVGGVRGVLLE